MESTFEHEELFSNEVKEEIIDSEEGQMQLTDGNDEHLSIKQKSFCNQKGSEFDDGADEEQHDVELNGEKKCPVDGCNQSASSSEDLIKHMKEHSAPWLCGVCKKFWPCASQLRLHFMTHTGEKPFKCDICEKRFSLSSNLKSHMRIHTGNSYNCSLCGYKTNFYDLKIHKRSHLGEKLNTCPICGKNPCTICDKHFRRSSDLVSHMRTHSGDKPYACDKCEFKAFFSCHLKRHNRTHTGDKPFSCACGYKTTTSWNLKSHQKYRGH